MSAVAAAIPDPAPRLEKKPVKFSNLLLGASLNMFEVTTLGQPLEVIKTTMAANRGDGVGTALGRIWNRGGVFGCKLLPPFFPVPLFFISISLSMRCASPTELPIPIPGRGDGGQGDRDLFNPPPP